MVNTKRENRVEEESSLIGRSLGINMTNSCPKCWQYSSRAGWDNKIKCAFCQTRWCWICRQHFDSQRSIEQHFAFYNVFGCPGLSKSPSYFFLTLLLNLVYVLFFPLTLFFAPMIIMIKNYQGLMLVTDQAQRF